MSILRGRQQIGKKSSFPYQAGVIEIMNKQPELLCIATNIFLVLSII